MATRLQLRRGTAAEWTSANPVLAQGEPGLETDTGKRKTGDGTTAWVSLAYDDASVTAALAAKASSASVATEASTRAAADTTLQGNIDALATTVSGVRMADTMSEVIASTTLAAGTLVTTLGFYALADGGGGTWEVEDASGETWVDTGLGHSVDALGRIRIGGSKRLARRESTAVRAAAYGLKTDSTNTALLQALVTFTASIGEWLILPKGTFTTAEVAIPSGAKIDGQGKDTILVASAIGNRSVFFIGTVTGVRIRNVTFKGTLAANAAKVQSTIGSHVASGIYLYLSDDVRLNGCGFTDFGAYGLRIGTTGGQTALSSTYRSAGLANTVTDCWAYNCFYGFMLDTGGEYNHLTGCDAANCRYAFYVKGGNNTMANCNGSFSFVGIYLKEVVGNNSGKGVCVGCTFNHNTTALYGDGITIGYVFTGCSFYAGIMDLILCSGILIVGGTIGTLTIRAQGGGRNQLRDMIVATASTMTHSYNSVLDDTILDNVVSPAGVALT